jgi:EmrB/QacA subfamily drug resistance transporter
MMLITARVVQGLGAALLNTQVWSMMIRVFPMERRGMVAGVWAGVAGVGNLVGPLAGGFLVDALGWKWIFFANLPIGIVGLALAVLYVPALPSHAHRFDLVGVGLSALGIFLIVFALQDGQSAGWAPWIWALIVAGIGFIAVFVWWQSVNNREPLIPLEIFRDRNFAMSSLAVTLIAFVLTATMLPGIFYVQLVCGLSPTKSAFLIAPIPIAAALLAPYVGKLVDRSRPCPVVGFGFLVVTIALTWFSIEMVPTTPVWRLAIPAILLGVGFAFVWPTLTATATRNLPAKLAGAGSGIYATVQALGEVLGSAGMAAFMSSRIHAEMPPVLNETRSPAAGGGPDATLQLPEFLRVPFSAAMSQSMLLPAFIALFGIVAAQFMIGFRQAGSRPSGDASAMNRIPAKRISMSPESG